MDLDCGGCDCGDCGDCCECGDCGDFCGGCLTGYALGCCDCGPINTGPNSKRNNGNGCFILFVILAIIALIIYFVVANSKSATDENGLTSYKIIKIEKEWRLFGDDDNTIVENTITGERKTLLGRKGEVGEIFKVKEK